MRKRNGWGGVREERHATTKAKAGGAGGAVSHAASRGASVCMQARTLSSGIEYAARDERRAVSGASASWAVRE